LTFGTDDEARVGERKDAYRREEPTGPTGCDAYWDDAWTIDGPYAASATRFAWARIGLIVKLRGDGHRGPKLRYAQPTTRGIRPSRSPFGRGVGSRERVVYSPHATVHLCL